MTIYLCLRSDRGLPQLYNILLFISLLQYPNAARTEQTECVHTGKDLWTERNIAGEICVSLSRTWTINLTKKNLPCTMWKVRTSAVNTLNAAAVRRRTAAARWWEISFGGLYERRKMIIKCFPDRLTRECTYIFMVRWNTTYNNNTVDLNTKRAHICTFILYNNNIAHIIAASCFHDVKRANTIYTYNAVGRYIILYIITKSIYDVWSTIKI